MYTQASKVLTMKVDDLLQRLGCLGAKHKLWAADCHEAGQQNQHLNTELHRSAIFKVENRTILSYTSFQHGWKW